VPEAKKRMPSISASWVQQASMNSSQAAGAGADDEGEESEEEEVRILHGRLWIEQDGAGL
jgi:hypothetical protein